MDDDVLTFDEILEDATYQAEFDKRVQKAIEKSMAAKENEFREKERALANKEEEIRKNVLEEMEAKAKEAEDNLSMQNQLSIIAKEKKAANYVKEKGYDPKVLKLMQDRIASIKDVDLEDKIDETNTLFSESVSAGLNEKLKENPDVMLGGKGKKEGPQFDFGFQSIKPEAK